MKETGIVKMMLRMRDCFLTMAQPMLRIGYSVGHCRLDILYQEGRIVMRDYLFGPQASPFQRGLAWAAIGLLVCACGLCGVSSTVSLSQIGREELAAAQTRGAVPVTATPTLTPLAAAATLSPTFTPTIIPIESTAFAPGGLGLLRAEWEQQHRLEDPSYYTPLHTGYDGLYDVAFEEDRVWSIDAQFEAPLTLPEAEERVQRLIPTDSQLNTTDRPENRRELLVKLYTSESLKTQFTGQVWGEGEPGQFTVQYTLVDDRVNRILITTGSNSS